MEERLLRADLDALTCERERRRGEHLPREPSHAGVGVDKTVNEPRNGDRRLADVEELRRGIAEIDHDLVHRAARARRDGEEAIDGNRLPVGASQEEEPTPRRPGQRPLGDEAGEGGRHDGVDRRSSLAQGPGSRLDGMTAPSRNRASHARSLRRCSRLKRGRPSGGSSAGRSSRHPPRGVSHRSRRPSRRTTGSARGCGCHRYRSRSP